MKVHRCAVFANAPQSETDTKLQTSEKNSEFSSVKSSTGERTFRLWEELTSEPQEKQKLAPNGRRAWHCEAGFQMGHSSFRLRLSTAKAEFVRQSKLCPAGRALRLCLIWRLDCIVFKGGDNCCRRHRDFFDRSVRGRSNRLLRTGELFQIHT